MEVEGTAVSPQTRGDESESFSAEGLGERVDDWDGASGYKPLGSMRARNLYDRDLDDERRGEHGKRRYYTRSELMGGDWIYIVDNDFALGIFKRMNQCETLRRQPAVTKLCEDCSSFRILSRFFKRGIKK